MTDWITGMTAWISLHSTLAYLFVFLLALSESIPVIGVVEPGNAAIIAVSTLVPTGSIKLWPMIAVAFAGAVVGDGAPFGIGHRYHASLLQRWPLTRYPKWVAKSESFIGKHGDKSVFLARFTPVVRAFVPLFTVAWTPDGNGSPIDVLIDSLPDTELVKRSDTNTCITRNVTVILVSDQFENANQSLQP